ncbi:MAG: GNAT family N-acetyltransferase [Candidatus Lutacidiplasmatales archaeon]
MPPLFRPPVRMNGLRIRHEPLELSHAAALVRLGSRPEIWQFMSYGPFPDTPSMESHVQELLRRQTAGTDLPFAVVRQLDGVAIGMTRFLNIDRENESAEIGGTWLDPAMWRGPYNTESKRMMLAHAFEVEGAHRVSIRTDLRNERSQRAIERIGGRREGILREERIVRNGYRRSTVVYSVLADEWPDIRRRLDDWIARAIDGAGGAPPLSPY